MAWPRRARPRARAAAGGGGAASPPPSVIPSRGLGILSQVLFMVLLAGLWPSTEAGIITDPLTQKLGYKKIIKEHVPCSTGSGEASPSANTLRVAFLMRANCSWAGKGSAPHTMKSVCSSLSCLPRMGAHPTPRRKGQGRHPRTGTGSCLPPPLPSQERAKGMDFSAENKNCTYNRWRETPRLLAGKCQPAQSAPPAREGN